MTVKREALDQRLVDLEEYYGTLRARWASDLAFYLGEFNMNLPADVSPVIPATGRNAVDVPATHIVTEKPVVQRRRNVHGKRSQADDDKVEAFLKAFLIEVAESAESPPLNAAEKYQLLYGHAILSGPFYNAKKHQNGDPNWLYFEAMDPTSVFLPTGPNPREVFIQFDTTVDVLEQAVEFEQRFDRFDRQGRRSVDIVRVVEWYGFETRTEKFVHYAAWEKSHAGWLTAPHTVLYPYLPVERVYSGYGLGGLGHTSIGYHDRVVSGDSPDRRRLEENLSTSILNLQVKTLLADEAYAYTVASAVMGTAAWERYRADPTKVKPEHIRISYAPGSVSWMPEGLALIVPEQIPAAVLQHLANVKGALSEALFSGVVQGQRPVGVGTASGLAILSGQARLKFGPPLRLLEFGTARTCRKTGLLLQAISELDSSAEFEMRGRAVQPGDWHNDYAVAVQLLAEDPEERNSRIAIGNTLRGELPRKEIWENYYGIENFSEALEQKLVEDVVLSDAARATIEATLNFMEPRRNGGRGQQPQGQGLQGLRGLNQQARLMRAARPGTSQQRALVGSVEEAAQQALLAGGTSRV